MQAGDRTCPNLRQKPAGRATQRPWAGDGNSGTRSNIVWAPEEQHRSPGWQGTARPATERSSTRDRAGLYQRRDGSRTRDRAGLYLRQGGVVPETGRGCTRDGTGVVPETGRGHSQKNVVFEEKKKTDNRPPGCVDGRNGGRFLWK